MKRREFVGALAGAVAWPSILCAQQALLPIVALVRSTTFAEWDHTIAAFDKGLAETGFIRNQNVVVEHHSAEGQSESLTRLIGTLVSRPVNLIVANGVAALAAKAATKTIPIVFASGFDPVRDGLVESLAKPGGNVTGVVFFSSIAGAKRLDLLRQLVPKASTIAVLVNITSSATAAELNDNQTAAQAKRQHLVVHTIMDERDLDVSFDEFRRAGAGALLVGAGTFLNSNRKGIVNLAAREALPAMYALREFATEGGLFSYGAST